MTSVHAAALEIATKLASVSPYLTTDEQALSAFTTLVQEVFQCDALLLSQFSPMDLSYRTIATRGYDPTVLHHLNGWFMKHDPAVLHQRTTRFTPARWADYPFDYSACLSAEQYFKPAGFREGVTLFLADGKHRHTGALHFNTAGSATIKNKHLFFLETIRTVLGTHVDWWRADLPDARRPADPALCYFLDEARTLQLVPDMAPVDQDDMDPDVLALVLGLPFRAHRELRGHLLSRRLGWLQATASRKGSGMLLVLRPVAKPVLTEREMDVSGGLIRGWSNKEIARRLAISEATVSNHVESILLKMRCRTRTAAAIACERAALSSLDLYASIGV